MFGWKRDRRAEVSPNNAMPCAAFQLIHGSLDMLRDILFNLTRGDGNTLKGNLLIDWWQIQHESIVTIKNVKALTLNCLKPSSKNSFVFSAVCLDILDFLISISILSGSSSKREAPPLFFFGILLWFSPTKSHQHEFHYSGKVITRHAAAHIECWRFWQSYFLSNAVRYQHHKQTWMHYQKHNYHIKYANPTVVLSQSIIYSAAKLAPKVVVLPITHSKHSLCGNVTSPQKNSR